GVDQVLSYVQNGMMVCMDAQQGVIVVEPDDVTLKEHQRKEVLFKENKEKLRELRATPTVTKSGKRIRLCVNVRSIEDIKKAGEYHVDGVGLFRSEFLYIENTHFPTEEEQFCVYAQAAKLCKEELTIRTLDIGGDKALPYFTLEPEQNPYLGFRAIRISLEMKDIFKQQLRAILRASVYGNVRIMFPMIISLEELRQAKQLVEECKSELKAEGIRYDEHIELGMMIETPASVLLASDFAKEADFFSIGTNDLTQYLLAVDRGNKKVATFYTYFHPAVLTAVEHVIKAGHENHISVGMCGEMAGDINATSLLLSFGLDEFSVSGENIDFVREKIIKWE
ncbi:MAG: phosphoenolpyruvate--protein phosphotransferase, partial [Clostridia bacterium]|nr:phosphoenolpyruvate--protein phosphotransferase [Clostridia bacterium]